MKYIIDVPDNTTWIQVSTDRLEPYTEPDLNITKDNSVHLCNSCNRMDSLVPCPTTDGDVLFGEDGKSVCCCKLYKPYTIDRKAIDLQHAHDIENVARMNYSKGAEDAWEFASMLMNMHPDVAEDIYWSMSGGKGIGVVAELTYQEAKARYEEWKKEKDEIRVGDEVEPKIKDGYDEKGVVLRLYQPKQYKLLADVLWRDETVDTMVVVEKLVRTGRHFDEVEELLKKMKEN